MPGQGEDQGQNQGQGLRWICAHYGKAALHANCKNVHRRLLPSFQGDKTVGRLLTSVLA